MWGTAIVREETAEQFQYVGQHCRHILESTYYTVSASANTECEQVETHFSEFLFLSDSPNHL